jgi:hypothetical protein
MRSDPLSQLQKFTKFIAEISGILGGYNLFRNDDDCIGIGVDINRIEELKQVCETYGVEYEEGLPGSIIINTKKLSDHSIVHLGIDEFKKYCRRDYNNKTETDMSNIIVIDENGAYLMIYNNVLVEASSISYSEVQYILLFYKFAGIVTCQYTGLFFISF